MAETERSCLLPPKRAFGRWSDDETAALIEAWKPLYRRRLEGEIDAWVPPRQHRVVRTSRNLVAEDWRALAVEVNARRAAAGLCSLRTHHQCKSRMAALSVIYCKELAGAAPSGWRFFGPLHDVWAPAAQPGSTPPPAGEAGEERHQQEDAAGEGDAPLRAPVWGRIKRPRSARPVSTSSDAAMDARGGAEQVDGLRAAVEDLFAGGALGVAPSSGGSVAVVSTVTEVAMKLVDSMCQAVMIKSLDAGGALGVAPEDAAEAASHGRRR